MLKYVSTYLNTRHLKFAVKFSYGFKNATKYMIAKPIILARQAFLTCKSSHIVLIRNEGGGFEEYLESLPVWHLLPARI